MKRSVHRYYGKNKVGLKKGEVIRYFGERLWGEFCKWIDGQTCALDENDHQPMYFPHDVERFIELRLEGKPTYWD